jgi:hypothetical protein
LGTLYRQRAGAQTTVDIKQKQLLLAKAYYEESHRTRTVIYGPAHTETVDAASQLATVVRELSTISLA